MLSVRDLVRRYDGRTVLDIAAFALPTASVTALVGPNGSGKSTLLRILAAVERPDEGVLRLDERPVRTNADRLAARRAITLVEQQPLLFDLSVRGNLRDALRLHGDSASADDRIDDALALVGARALGDRAARTLSGGETQRVAIARAMLLAPRVLLLDEPLSAADRAARDALADALAALRERGTTVCFSSHLLEDAYRWSTRLFTLVDGRIEAVTPENLFRADLPPGQGSRTIQAGPLALTVVTDRVGPCTLAIPPEDILVSLTPLTSSARNQFPGRVSAIGEDGRGRIRLVVDVGTDLVVRITPAALAELDLHVGSPVFLAVKAMAVRVF